MSPTASDPSSDVDSLVTETANKLANVINDFKRQLDRRDGTWAHAHGTFEISMKTTNQSETYELVVVPDEDGVEYPITVYARRTKGKDNADSHPRIRDTTSSLHQPTRRDSDAELEKDIISRKKRKLSEGDDGSRKRQRPDTDEDEDEDEDEDDIMPLITKEDLDSLLSQLREDIQEDTSECVNHVQRLLRRFKDEWHEHVATIARQDPRPPPRDSVINGSTPTAGAFPSLGTDRNDQNATLPAIIHREAELVSSQIRWVEECRRVAADVHDKREETWRTSSAGFHDRVRQDRENFQNQILNEQNIQGRVLNQILNEVKAIGLYSQSMKWETPSHLTTHSPYSPTPTRPAFPTQPPPPPPVRGPTQAPPPPPARGPTQAPPPPPARGPTQAPPPPARGPIPARVAIPRGPTQPRPPLPPKGRGR
ncbi:hypothetical protein K504DRAFT_390795 [Pleomassaria siparia CBS 279.74]|uniref:Uncharacterized protein n=1 Tax=Pleomassaria siparia CBS 279.74 TaxID=1314801 RepID=A0A6G1JVA4_9PLEO|nr:hypothetical protein K504DRAFT_390795 [Pleomassaria siparia CBS 279.74]